ncbi:MAG: gamma-glutamyl-gamma-aminobutyrate hydrolase family protein [Nanoarchaeota archaeon]
MVFAKGHKNYHVGKNKMEVLITENDFFTNVERALNEIDENWKTYHGLIITGSHVPSEVEKKLEAIKRARENNVPFLGICFGMQLAVIEYARNVMNVHNANTQEITMDTNYPVVHKLPELRVGIYPVNSWWGQSMESHWHNYSFNRAYHKYFEGDWDISYTGEIAEIMKLRKHPFFMGVQFHAEYQSSQEKPHPILFEFLRICKLDYV